MDIYDGVPEWNKNYYAWVYLLENMQLTQLSNWALDPIEGGGRKGSEGEETTFTFFSLCFVRL